MEQFCEIILNLDQWLRRKCRLKIFIIWSSGCRFVQLLEPFVKFWWRVLCEIILNLDQWFRRRYLLKIFIMWSSGGPFVKRGGTICAILVEGIKRTISVK